VRENSTNGATRVLSDNSTTSHDAVSEGWPRERSNPPTESLAACLSGVSPREGSAVAVSNNPLQDSRFRNLARERPEHSKHRMLSG
jgi:hypothetical protein